jgi:putative DNA-invertase from lambdoid prophage Rac
MTSFSDRYKLELIMATFGYGRVSTTSQNPDNQKLELDKAGYQIDYWFEDTGISGKTSASQRPQFIALLEKIRDGETLVVSKLDRLGRDAIDVLQTVKQLSQRSIKIIVHQIGSTDLSSPAGKMLLTMLAAVAEMERDLLIERTQSGLERAKLEGKVLGRPFKTNEAQRSEIIQKLSRGETVSQISREFKISRGTVINIRNTLSI